MLGLSWYVPVSIIETRAFKMRIGEEVRMGLRSKIEYDTCHTISQAATAKRTTNPFVLNLLDADDLGLSSPSRFTRCLSDLFSMLAASFFPQISDCPNFNSSSKTRSFSMHLALLLREVVSLLNSSHNLCVRAPNWGSSNFLGRGR